jgi:hypothetical protein
MRTYLVVAHRTLVGQGLIAHVGALGSPEELRLHLVVPVHHPVDHAWSDGEVEATAAARLAEGIEAFRAQGYQVTGEVGDANPVYAVTTALRDSVPDCEGVVISTLPSGLSRWLHVDAVHRIRREVNLPVIHVVAREHAWA